MPRDDRARGPLSEVLRQRLWSDAVANVAAVATSALVASKNVSSEKIMPRHGDLVTMLSNRAGAPVLNQTGLAGNFDATLRFSLGSAGPPSPNAPPPSAAADDSPSLFSAVQEQLGLKLTPAKAAQPGR